MPPRPRPAPFSTAVVLALVVGAVGGQAVFGDGLSASTLFSTLLTATAPKPYFPGRPAITPTLPVTNAATPTFTEGDVRAYFGGANPRLGFRISATQITVRRVLFATNAGVRRQFGQSVETPDSRLICAVELAGDFTISGPFATTPVVRPTAYLFFDAKTGNILVESVP